MYIAMQLAMCGQLSTKFLSSKNKFIWGNLYIANHKKFSSQKFQAIQQCSEHYYTYNNTIVIAHQSICMHVYSCVCNMKQLWLRKAVTYGQYRTSFLLLSSSSMLASSWTICNKIYIYICNCILTLHCNVYNSYSYVRRYICHH